MPRDEDGSQCEWSGDRGDDHSIGHQLKLLGEEPQVHGRMAMDMRETQRVIGP
jgi:hypothetical protein